MPGRTRNPRTTTNPPAEETPDVTTTEITPEQAAEAAAVATPKRSYGDLDIEITDVKVVKEGNPFARGSYTLPDDHPIMELFNASLANEAALTVTTPNPRDAVRLLQRAATQLGRGVKIDKYTRKHLSKEGGPYNGEVTFKAMSKRAYSRKPKTSDATKSEETTTE